MFVTALLLLWIGYCPERYALVEINHRYNSPGDLAYTQAIFQDYNYQSRRMDVQAWRMIEDVSWPLETSGGWEMMVRTSDGWVEVRCDMMKETFTLHDPERANIRLFDTQYRRGLRKR
jgi:hypothetical protein